MLARVFERKILEQIELGHNLWRHAVNLAMNRCVSRLNRRRIVTEIQQRITRFGGMRAETDTALQPMMVGLARA